MKGICHRSVSGHIDSYTDRIRDVIRSPVVTSNCAEQGLFTTSRDITGLPLVQL